jgi:uncharacterized protein YndB with AHSA1/START domain
MPYTYTLTTVIPATPQEIYEAWLDSVAHSEMTGGDASISGEVGAEFSAWDEYITGRNLELVPAERIVQSWRTDEYGDENEHSTVTITFEETDDGTLLTLVHSNVPDDQRAYEEGGWESNYFEPMKLYFARRQPVAPEPEQAMPPEAPPPSFAPPEGGEKPAPAVAKKPGVPKRRMKVAAKKKTKRANTAKAKRKAAKPPAKPPAKRKTAKPPSKRKMAKPLAKKSAKRKARARKSSRRPRAHR